MADPDRAGDLYRSTDLLIVPLSYASSLVYSRPERSVSRVPSEMAALLRACSGFATVGEHAARCAVPVECIQDLATAGLLVSARDLYRACRAAAVPEESPPPVALAGIPTRNRPECLERAINTFGSNFSSYDRRVEIVVADSAAAQADEDCTASVLRRVTGDAPGPLRWAPRTDVEMYARALHSASGVSLDLILFALLGDGSAGISTGATRNALLLDSAGCLCVQLDDDSSGRLVQPPELYDDAAFCSGDLPLECWFFHREAELEASCVPLEGDLIGLHSRLLGKTLGACFGDFASAGGVHLTGVAARHDRLLRSGQGRIRVTTAGVAGDAATGSAAYLFAPLSWEDRLPEDEAGFLTVVRNRQVLRAPLQTSISQGPALSSFHLGLDNRQLLPPFFPVGRGSDIVFGRILRVCFPKACVGALPFALRHQPPGRRVHDWDEFWSNVAGITLSVVMGEVIDACSEGLENLDECTALERLGRRMAETGRLPAADLTEVLQLRIWQSAEWRMPMLRQRLARASGTRGYLTTYRERYIQTVTEALLRPDYVVPRDVVSGSTSDAMQLSAQLMVKFGEVLQEWPRLMKAARDLRSQGVRLGRALSGDP